MSTIVDDINNSQIKYTYTDNGTVQILTGMTYDYVEGGINNTVATLPNFITEISENFADGSVIGSESLQYITELTIGENVTHFRKGICKNWTRLSHLRLELKTLPTVDVDFVTINNGAQYSSSLYSWIAPAPTSFKNSVLNTLSLYIDFDLPDTINYLLGPIANQIVTLNVIEILNQSFSSDSVLITQSQINNPGYFKLLNVTSINIPTETNVLPTSFIGFVNLTSISMPSVTSIGTNVFFQCRSLTSISMPSISSIGLYAFELCPINIESLQQLYYQGFLSVKTDTTYGFNEATQSEIQPYNITDNAIISIPAPEAGPYYITIPDTITAIAASAAANATFITSLTIPESVTFIGTNAFSGCSNLTSVVLPSSDGSGYATLEQDAFFGTNVSQSSLQAMLDQGYIYENLVAAGFTIVPDIETTINYIISAGGALTSITNLPASTNFALTIPSTATSINASVVTNNVFLTALTIPSTVTSIGSNAFSGSSKLVTLVLPGLNGIGLVRLDENAFAGTAVRSSTLRTMRNQGYDYDNLVYAGFTNVDLLYNMSYTYDLDTSIQDQIILKLVTYSGFGEKTFFMPKEVTSIYETDGDPYVESKGDPYVFLTPIDIIDCSNNTKITKWTPFYGDELSVKNMILPSSLTVIEFYSFSGWKQLESISIPPNVSLGVGCFNETILLDSVKLTLLMQGYTKIALQGSENSLTGGALCSIPNSFPTVQVTNNSIVSISSDAAVAAGNPIYFSLNIPKNIITIDNNAVKNNIFVTSITVPTSVTIIGAEAFSGCFNLTSVVLPGLNGSGYATLEEDAFFGTAVSQSSLQAMLDQGYTPTQLSAAGFTNVPLPVAISYDVSGDVLTGITVNPSDSYFELTIPSDVTSINENALNNNLYLTALTIPLTVASIGSNAFSGCSGLVTLVLPTSPLVTLGPNAFFGTTNINTASLQNIKTQGYSANNLRVAGFTASQLKAAEFDATELRIGGYTIADLKLVPNNAYPDADILAAGYSASELQAAGLYTPPVNPVPCFNENSKILCLIDGQEKEVLVQNLRSGVLVKTFYSGYKPVCMIGTSVLYNPATDERFNDRLFICKKEKYLELNEDLIITGCHSILVDEITPLQREKIIKQMGAIYETENNYRLNAVLDDRAEPYNCAGKFNIYHIALEHDNYYANYGVYANGLLVETCSKRYLKELSKMRLL